MPEIESGLVAELESALQAVLKSVPQPQPAKPAYPAVPSSAAEFWQNEATHPGLHITKAERLESGAAEGIQPSYPRLWPAQNAEAPQALSWELEAPADDHWMAPDQTRRRRIAPRAALCVAGLLGLAATGAVALTSLVGSGEPPPAILAEQAPAPEAAPAAVELAANPAADAADEPSAAPRDVREASAPTGMAGETAGSDVTLLRPVGNEDTAAAALPAMPSSAVRPGKRSPEEAGTAQDNKMPDRLVEAPAPAEEAPQAEAAAGDGASQPAESAVTLMPPADGPAAAASAPSPSPFDPGWAGTATPEFEGGGELVASADAQPGETPPDGLATGETDDADASAELDAAMPDASAADTTQTDLTAAGSDAEAESSRSAPVTRAVNMRAGPANDAAVLTVVPAGSQVDVIECDYWCEVVFAGERGWIYKSFVRGAES